MASEDDKSLAAEISSGEELARHNPSEIIFGIANPGSHNYWSLVAESSTESLSVIAASKLIIEPLKSDPTGRQAWLAGTAVHPDHRHRGIATEMRIQREDLARTLGAQWIGAIVEAEKQEIFSQRGYEIVAERGLSRAVLARKKLV